jgi:hypothetical protein
VNIFLYSTGTGQVFPIRMGVASSPFTYVVPAAMPLGNYEVRVTSTSDARVEAKQPVSVREPYVEFTSPSKGGCLWPPNTVQTVQWKYYGAVVQVKLVLVDNLGNYFMTFPVDPSQLGNGQGWMRFTVPATLPLRSPDGTFAKSYCFIALRTTDSKKLATSPLFSLQPGTGSGYTTPGIKK